jgi:hypothetical protein
VAFDTAASDLWVASSMCDETCKDSFHKFNTSLSSTYKPVSNDASSANNYTMKWSKPSEYVRC